MSNEPGRTDVPVNTKHDLYYICTMLNQRQRRWADVVQTLYKWFVFTDILYSAVRSQKTVHVYWSSKQVLAFGLHDSIV